MNAKTMEGLAGAHANINLVRVPMRVYNDARRRGDTATMERAMGYAGEFAERAGEYREITDEGMREEAEEAREKEELELEEAIQNRREEQEKLEASVEESRNGNHADALELSEAGKELLKENIDMGNICSPETRADAGKEPVIYQKTGTVGQKEQGRSISISV